MGNYYVLVALKEKKYVSFSPFSKEMEIMCNHHTLELAVGFLRMFDRGYGGGEGIFAFIGDQWTPHIVFDPDTGAYVNWEYVLNNYKDVTAEVIQDLIDDGIRSSEDQKDGAC